MQSDKNVGSNLWLYFILGTPSPEIKLASKFREDPQEQKSKNKIMPLNENVVLQVCSILIKYILIKNWKCYFKEWQITND